jgi:hypothetical protein
MIKSNWYFLHADHIDSAFRFHLFEEVVFDPWDVLDLKAAFRVVELVCAFWEVRSKFLGGAA